MYRIQPSLHRFMIFTKSTFATPFLFLILVLSSGILSSCKTNSRDTATKPLNVIIIMADDLGYGDLSCYGNKAYSTPNIDQLATEGMLFKDYHSNGAVCSPTRAALVTGRYQQRAGIEGVVTAANHRDTGLDTTETTIAEVLLNHGYGTAIYGKWHLGYLPAFNPVRQGFQEFRGYVSGNVDYHSHIDQGGVFDWWQQDKLTDDRGYSTDLITRYGLEFLEGRGDSPFLLYLAHEAPHYPYQGRGDKGERTVGGQFPNVGSRKDVHEAYKEMVVALDEGVGAIKNKVIELGIEKNTLILFISDNGATNKGSNGVLNGFKGTLWEGGHRVPMIAWWPGRINALQYSSELVMSMDLFPTILSLAGIDKKINLDGVDFAPVLLNNENLPDRTVCWRYNDWKCIREGPWKLLIHNENRYLFNLDKDLNEKRKSPGAGEGYCRSPVQRIGEVGGGCGPWSKKTNVVYHVQSSIFISSRFSYVFLWRI